MGDVHRVARSDRGPATKNYAIAFAKSTAVLAGIALPVIAMLAVPVAPAGPAAAATALPESPCTITATKYARPHAAVLGDDVTMTLRMAGTCPLEPLWMHVELVLDESEAVGRSGLTDLRALARAVIDQLESAQSAEYPKKVGVVSYNLQAWRRCALTDDFDAARRCVDWLRPQNEGRLSNGIDRGVTELHAARTALDGREVIDVMVVIATGPGAELCAETLRAARSARGEGVLMIAVCVGTDCDEPCLRQVASSPRYYYRPGIGGGPIFPFLWDRLPNVLFNRVTIVDTLPPELEFRPASAVPAPIEVGNTDGRLAWDQFYVPREGITITYLARPLATGIITTSVSAVGIAIDGKGRQRSFAFAVPAIEVSAPTVTPSATWTPTASATALPEPTVVPPWTPTPTPIATSTDGQERPLYLPALGDD